MKIKLLNKFQDDYRQLEIDENCESVLNYFNFHCLSLGIENGFEISHLLIKKAGYDTDPSWNDDLYYVYLNGINLGFISKIPKDYEK